jgi:hypothetical protein
METLPLARMTPELLAKLDGNVGVSKRRDEAMSQAVEAPCEYVASRTALFGLCVASAPLFAFPTPCDAPIFFITPLGSGAFQSRLAASQVHGECSLRASWYQNALQVFA